MKWDISKIKEWKYYEHPQASTVLDAGNAENYETGGWRSERPVRDTEKCSQCLICFIYCPDSSIVVEKEEMTGFDLKHCKGCGICAEVCPKDAITMVNEAEFAKGEK